MKDLLEHGAQSDSVLYRETVGLQQEETQAEKGDWGKRHGVGSELHTREQESKHSCLSEEGVAASVTLPQ